LFASLIKSQRVDEDTISHYIKLYKDYASIVLKRKSSGNSGMDESLNDFIFINYNKWFLDDKYRQSIAKKLGFITDGKNYERVPKAGGGSTFEGLSLDGKAENLKVLERWKSMKDHPLYQKIKSDKELHEYSNQLFGDILNLK
jgi:hypothetical protein